MNTHHNSVIYELDATDKRILTSLHDHARWPLSKIAKTTGVKRDTAAYRIEQLEKAGVIKGYVARIEQSLFATGVAAIHYKLSRIETTHMQKALRTLSAHNAVNWVAEVCGPWDIIVTVFYTGPQDLADTANSLAKELGALIREQRIDLYIEEYKFDRLGVITGKTREAIAPSVRFSGKQTPSLDIKDAQILKILAPACRTTNTAIAEKLAMSEDAIRMRIKTLETKGIITGYTITINPYALGLEGYTVELQLESAKPESFAQLRSFVAMQPYISFCARSAGTRNAVLTMYCTSKAEFTNALRTLRSHFGPTIVDYDIMLGIAEHKEVFVPPQFFDKKSTKHLKTKE